MKRLLSLLLMLLVVGCKEEKRIENIEMICDDTKTNFSIQKEDIIICNLTDKKYEFKVQKIKEKEINLISNTEILDKKEFILEKDKALEFNIDDKVIVIRWNN